MELIGKIDCDEELIRFFWCSSITERSVFFRDIDEIIDEYKSDFIAWDEFTEDGGTISEDFFDNYCKFEEELVVCLNEKDEVVGFFSFEPFCSRSDVPVEDEEFGYLSLAIIIDRYRDSGIGQFAGMLIMDILRDEFGHSSIYLSTWEGNNRQFHIFTEKFGFEIVARKENHRSDGSDTVYFGRGL